MNLDRAVTVADLRLLARRRLPRAVFDFIDGAADDERTLRANLSDFDAILLKQRILADVAATRLDCSILGAPAAAPLLIGPTGLANLTCPHADLILAREARSAGIPFVLSTSSGSTLEEVAGVGKGERWFQLYVFKDRSITERLIERAQAAGYQAMVLTVDVPVVGKRRRDVRNGFTIPLTLTPASILDFAMHPRWCLEIWRHGVPTMRNFSDAIAGTGAASHAALMNSQLDPTLNWKVLAWLRERWHGPILIKGILALEDAIEAVAQGVDGIVVSNHGGRQLDGVPSSISALAQIGPAIGRKVPLFLDGGVRRGSDVVRAVALGAQAVLVGRPTLYAAAAGGARGVRRCLQILTEDMHRTLAQIGRASIADVDEDCLARFQDDVAARGTGGAR
jgi:isopentenyl diphosphate isomerase/L-lactate dehydrogenase-like FMN-dependent dehydrogenase